MTLPLQGDVKLWLALLHEIDTAGGSCLPADSYPRLRKYFPDITDSDVRVERDSGGNAWANTIQWARLHLVNRGFIDNSQRGIWVITPQGRNWLKQYWKGSNEDYSEIDKPPVVQKDTPKLRDAKNARSRTFSPSRASTLRKLRETGVKSQEGALEHEAFNRQIAPIADGLDHVQQLIVRAITGPKAARFSPTEKYLVAILAYEIDWHSQAFSLADASLAEGLSNRYRAKAEHLRELCSIKLQP